MTTRRCILLALASTCVIAGARTPKAPSAPPPGVAIRKDVPYLAKDRKEMLDLYTPADRPADRRSPAIVIIHGGGWVNGDKGGGREWLTGTTLAKAGYVCVSVNYEMNAGNRWPTNLHDCKNAVRWLRVNASTLQLDPDHIGVIGGSAGGHLALLVAYTADDPQLSPKEPYPGVSDRVSACVDMYGITNLLTRRETQPDGTPTEEFKSHRLFKETREEAPEKWRMASPVAHITEKSPPTFILHGTADTTVDRDQSKELDTALRAAGVESTLRMVPGANHAWALKTDDFDLTGDVTAFFDKYLKVTR